MTSTSAATSLMMPAAPSGGPLPQTASILAVTARPGQESADLGGLLYAFRRPGTSLALLCLTRGEASPLNSTYARMEAIRPWEVHLAASVLGISSVAVASYPDGALGGHPASELTEQVRRAIREHSADLLLVIDPATGDPDDIARAAAEAAEAVGVSAVAHTRRGVTGAWTIDLGAEAETARAIQKSAIAAHASQSEGLPRLIRRLDLLDGRERLRWLVSPQRTPEHDRKPWPPERPPLFPLLLAPERSAGRARTKAALVRERCYAFSRGRMTIVQCYRLDDQAMHLRDYAK